MTISDKQRKFTWMVSELIRFIYLNGMACTFGCARCAQIGHHKDNSLHYSALAIDLNLFLRGPKGEWVYTQRTEDHQTAGEFWEAIGGSWGGRYNDGNHYSLEHEGRK